MNTPSILSPLEGWENERMREWETGARFCISSCRLILSVSLARHGMIHRMMMIRELWLWVECIHFVVIGVTVCSAADFAILVGKHISVSSVTHSLTSHRHNEWLRMMMMTLYCSHDVCLCILFYPHTVCSRKRSNEDMRHYFCINLFYCSVYGLIRFDPLS